MRNYRGISRLLHILILCCFFLPFLKSCHFIELTEEEKKFQDSIVTAEGEAGDSLKERKMLDFAYSRSSETVKERSFADRIFSTLLMPGGDYSGIALVFTSYKSPFLAFTILPCFILAVCSLVLVFRKKKNANRLFILAELMTIFLIAFFIFPYFDDILYGSWLTLFFCCLNVWVLLLYKRSVQSQ